MFTVLHGGREYAINHVKSANIDFAINDVPELDLTVVNRENNPAYPYLNEEAVVLVNGHEWRIKAESERTNYKTLKALHIFMDLDEMPFKQLLSGTYAPGVLLSTILNGTGFTLDIDAADLEDVVLEEFGRTDKWTAFKDAISKLEAEFTLLPGRIIQVRKQLSSDKGEQIRYGYNVKSLAKKTDSSDIVTHVIVFYGEEYENEATFVSSNAGNYDREYYGDIIKDARITNFETARKRAQKVFKDIDISYEVSCIATNKQYELGEIVHTIYEPLNDLNVTTRVQNTKYVWNGDEFLLSDITVGNYVFKSADALLQEQIKKTEDDAAEKLDEAKKMIRIRFEDTEKIIADQYTTITSEYASAITLTAQELRTDMTAHVTTINSAMGAQYSQITAEYQSSISQTAQQLRTDFNASITSVNNNMTVIENNVSSLTQTANSLQSTVSSHTTTLNGYGTRISSAESSITQHANQISQKVSQTEYNGNTIASLVNQTATTVTIQASKINLVGAVSVLSDITGNLGTITSGNINIYNDISVGRNINMRGTGTSKIQFADRSYIQSVNDTMDIDAWNRLNIYAPNVVVAGNWDFSLAASLTGVAASHTSGLGFAYSSASNQVKVRINGSEVGSIQL